MHSNFNDLKTKTMEATHLIKEKLIDGTAKRVAIKDVLIRQSDLVDMLEEYHKAKLKLLGIGNVSQRSELVDFMKFLFDNWQPKKHLTAEMLVDGYLKSTCG